MISLVGVLAVTFTCWLQGGMEAPPSAIRTTRHILPATLRPDKNPSAKIASYSNTNMHLYTFDEHALDAFLLESVHRGFFFRAYNILRGDYVARAFAYDATTIAPFCKLSSGHRLPGACSNFQTSDFLPHAPFVSVHCLQVLHQTGVRGSSSDVNLPSPAPGTSPLNYSFAFYSAYEPGSAVALPVTFLIDNCVFPLRSLLRIPIASWYAAGVLQEDECEELVSLGIISPEMCFSTLRRWCSRGFIWTWITDVERDDACYMICKSIQDGDPFPFELYDPDLPRTHKKASCPECLQLALNDYGFATRAMFKVAIWFCQYALYHQALYEGGIALRGYHEPAAAALFLEVTNNRAGRDRRAPASLLKEMARRGAYLERPGYAPDLEHAAAAGEVLVAFALSAVSDPGVWVAATLARQITVRVLVAESGRGLPLGQKWRWMCVGRASPLAEARTTQGMAVWGFRRRRAWLQALYGWAVVAASVLGTRFRVKAAEIGWCANFAVPHWVGWLAFGAVALVTVTSFLLSFAKVGNPSVYVPADFGQASKPSPLAAEPNMTKWTIQKFLRLGTALFGLAVAVVLVVNPTRIWLSYVLEGVAGLIWILSEEYSLTSGYVGSAVAIAIAMSGLCGVCRGIQSTIPLACFPSSS